MRTIKISKIKDTTQLVITTNGVAEVINCNSSRTLVAYEFGVMIVNDPTKNELNNFKIPVADLINTGIDFTGVVTGQDLADKLALETCFKYGGWLGSGEIQDLIDGSFTAQHKVDIVLNKAKVGVKAKIIGLTELKDEFTKCFDLGDVSGVLDLPFTSGIQWTFNMIGPTTLTHSVLTQGKTITIVTTGNYTITFPEGIDTNDLVNYDGTKKNVINLTCISTAPPFYSATSKAYSI